MTTANIPQTGAESGKINAVHATEKLQTWVPNDIATVLELDALDSSTETAINYIKAMVVKLKNLPKAQRNTWLNNNPEFMQWIESFPRRRDTNQD